MDSTQVIRWTPQVRRQLARSRQNRDRFAGPRPRQQPSQEIQRFGVIRRSLPQLLFRVLLVAQADQRLAQFTMRAIDSRFGLESLAKEIRRLGEPLGLV